MPAAFSVVALVAAFNEADIIAQVVGDLIEQGIHVYFLDDGSTDGTVAAVEPYLGRGVLGIERHEGVASDAAPAVFEWERILLRKAQLARELDASWFIHHDADEFRESPWSHLKLKDAIQHVDALGFNAIDFTSLDFWPVHDNFRAGDDVRAAFPFYAERAPYDRLQIRCWKKAPDLDLASSGGHDAEFRNRKVFPVRFILRHYPIRGQAHGERKVFHERRNRFLQHERARGWHVQYDEAREGTSFIRDRSTLTPYDAEGVRFSLMLRHRGVEALEASLADATRNFETQRGELEQRRAALRDELARRLTQAADLRAELETRDADLQAHAARIQVLETEVGRRAVEIEARGAAIGHLEETLEHCAMDVERLRHTVDERTRLLDELHQSLSWRVTAPLRAIARLLGLR